MARFHPKHDNAPILQAAEKWKAQCFLGDQSILSAQALWTPAHIDELVHAFVNNLDFGSGSFQEKLKAQIELTSASAQRLMAEMLWVLMLFQTNIKPPAKRNSIREVWEWSGEMLPEACPPLSDSVLMGIGSPGTAYNTQRWRELRYLIRLIRSFKTMDGPARRDKLNDPWRFGAWVDQVPDEGNRQFRHIILYFSFPDHFERITTSTDKQAILVSLSGLPGRHLSKLEVDKALLDLRRRLEAEAGTNELDFYQPRFKDVWNPPSTGHWLLSWNPDKWPWTSFFEDKLRVERGERIVTSWSCAARKVKAGDVVWLMRTAVEPRGIMARGSVINESYEAQHWDPEKAKAGETTRKIDVELREIRDATREPLVPLAALHAAAPDQDWSPQQSGISVKTRAAAALEQLWQERIGAEQEGETPPPPAPPQPALKERPRNVIFYGPPGTGKTWTLLDKELPRYVQRATEVSREEWVQAKVGGLRWWEIIALALHTLDGAARVEKIIEHPYFRAKAKLRDNKNLRATCWNALQYHTAPESETVRVAVDRRTEPFLFDKQKDGKWILVDDWTESSADLLTLAQALAAGPEHSAELIRRHAFVTFHQSYSYEDFVEGIRPKLTDNGSLTYEVQEGIFREICRRAKADPDHRYAIFIDEINRGNVARIFGELITLIEPDKRGVYDVSGQLTAGMETTLPYSRERFTVPTNLDIFGTMNTADRSVALLDTALRRRFEFEELMPEPGHIAGVRDGRIPDGEGGEIDLRRLLQVMNRRIAHLLHRDQTIGHAYLIDVKDFVSFRRVLVHSLVPLLQEYFYEDWHRIRLVLGDAAMQDADLQIIRKRADEAVAVFGPVEHDLGAVVSYDVTPEEDITPDAVRKIYEFGE